MFAPGLFAITKIIACFLDDSAPLRNELFAAHPGGLGVDVYFVRRFVSFGAPADLIGLSSRPGVPASGLSGVVLALDETIPTRSKAAFELVLPHELAHLLGLFHATENPEGPLARTEDGLEDTTTGDADNLIHFNPEGAGLSPSQKRLLLASPLVASAGR